MTPLPKHLEEIRDELTIGQLDIMGLEGPIALIVHRALLDTFNQAASIMLKDMEEMARAIQAYNDWLDGCDKWNNGKINEGELMALADNAVLMNQKTLKIWREKYKPEGLG